MRAVLDTTVLISALLAPGGRVASIINRLAEAAFILVYSEQLMTEILRVLDRPYVQHLNERRGGDIDGLRDLIRQRGALVLPTRAITICRDPKDDCVLEAAVAGAADVVVTGDKDLLVLDPFEGIRIVSPADFLAMLDSPAGSQL